MIKSKYMKLTKKISKNKKYVKTKLQKGGANVGQPKTKPVGNSGVKPGHSFRQRSMTSSMKRPEQVQLASTGSPYVVKSRHGKRFDLRGVQPLLVSGVPVSQKTVSTVSLEMSPSATMKTPQEMNAEARTKFAESQATTATQTAAQVATQKVINAAAAARKSKINSASAAQTNREIKVNKMLNALRAKLNSNPNYSQTKQQIMINAVRTLDLQSKSYKNNLAEAYTKQNISHIAKPSAEAMTKLDKLLQGYNSGSMKEEAIFEAITGKKFQDISVNKQQEAINAQEKAQKELDLAREELANIEIRKIDLGPNFHNEDLFEPTAKVNVAEKMLEKARQNVEAINKQGVASPVTGTGKTSPPPISPKPNIPPEGLAALQTKASPASPASPATATATATVSAQKIEVPIPAVVTSNPIEPGKLASPATVLPPSSSNLVVAPTNVVSTGKTAPQTKKKPPPIKPKPVNPKAAAPPATEVQTKTSLSRAQTMFSKPGSKINTSNPTKKQGNSPSKVVSPEFEIITKGLGAESSAETIPTVTLSKTLVEATSTNAPTPSSQLKPESTQQVKIVEDFNKKLKEATKAKEEANLKKIEAEQILELAKMLNNTNSITTAQKELENATKASSAAETSVAEIQQNMEAGVTTKSRLSRQKTVFKKPTNPGVTSTEESNLSSVSLPGIKAEETTSQPRQLNPELLKLQIGPQSDILSTSTGSPPVGPAKFKLKTQEQEIKERQETYDKKAKELEVAQESLTKVQKKFNNARNNNKTTLAESTKLMKAKASAQALVIELTKNLGESPVKAAENMKVREEMKKMISEDPSVKSAQTDLDLKQEQYNKLPLTTPINIKKQYETELKKAKEDLATATSSATQKVEKVMDYNKQLAVNNAYSKAIENLKIIESTISESSNSNNPQLKEAENAVEKAKNNFAKKQKQKEANAATQKEKAIENANKANELKRQKEEANNAAEKKVKEDKIQAMMKKLLKQSPTPTPGSQEEVDLRKKAEKKIMENEIVSALKRQLTKQKTLKKSQTLTPNNPEPAATPQETTPSTLIPRPASPLASILPSNLTLKLKKTSPTTTETTSPTSPQAIPA